MKLKLKHLSSYLPNDLTFTHERFGGTVFTLNSAGNEFVTSLECSDLLDIDGVKPILRPLSDINKSIEINGERFVPINRIDLFLMNYGVNKLAWQKWVERFDSGDGSVWDLPAFIFEKLTEWHFDVHGIIEYELATNINEL